jgi:hypothetical protein
MRSKTVSLVLLLCPLAAGCGNLFTTGTRNLLYEANLIKDNRFEHIHDEHLAHQAWRDVVRANPEHAYSTDYACGFKAGFVDYLYAGGSGEPPALPPKRYRRYHGMSPEGCQGLLDWFAGFRHGAAEARQSGLRRLMVVPLPPPPAHAALPAPAVIAGPPLEGAIPAEPPAALPMPRKTPLVSPPQAQAAPEETGYGPYSNSAANPVPRDQSPTQPTRNAADAAPAWRVRKWSGQSSTADKSVVEEEPILENQP